MASTPAPTTEASPDPADAPEGSYRWYVLALLTLTSMFSVADRLVFGILVEDIKAEFGLSDFELGLLGGAAFSLVYVIAGFPAARLADRSVRKNIVAAAISFWSVMTAMCGRYAKRTPSISSSNTTSTSHVSANCQSRCRRACSICM